RAREVLAELERERTVEHLDAHAARAGETSPQLALFAGDHPVIEALRALEPAAMTPLAALELVAEWKKNWGGWAALRPAPPRTPASPGGERRLPAPLGGRSPATRRRHAARDSAPPPL